MQFFLWLWISGGSKPVGPLVFPKRGRQAAGRLACVALECETLALAKSDGVSGDGIVAVSNVKKVSILTSPCTSAFVIQDWWATPLTGHPKQGSQPLDSGHVAFRRCQNLPRCQHPPRFGHQAAADQPREEARGAAALREKPRVRLLFLPVWATHGEKAN